MTGGGEIVRKLGSEKRVWEMGDMPPSPGHQIIEPGSVLHPR